MPTRTILQLVAFDKTGDTHHRMRWPGEILALHEPEWLVVNLDSSAIERFSWGLEADLLVIYQSHDLDLLPIIAARRARGLKTLVEYNDNFYDPPPASPVYEQWCSPLVWQVYEEFIGKSDGVIVTCEALADRLKAERSAEYHVLRNHYPFQIGTLPALGVGKPERIRIGWAGSLGHVSDLLAVQPALRRFLDNNSEIEFALMGNSSFPMLLGIPENQFKFFEWGGMTEYLSFWRTCHVGVVPLLNTPYNACRSDVKAVEMVSQGVLPLLPKAPPYSEFIAKTACPAWETWDELISHLKIFTSNSAAREAAFKRCYEYVSTERLLEGDRSRHDLYEKACGELRTAPAWSGGRTGFVEVQGTKSPTATYPEYIAAASKRAEQGDNLGAIKLLDDALLENDGNADLLLGRLRLLKASKDKAEVIPEIEKAILRFPRDARLLLEGVTFPGVSSADWKRVLSWLKSSPEHQRKFFSGAIVAEALRGAQQEFVSEEQIAELIKILPTDPNLKMYAAGVLAGRGEHAASVEVFDDLLKVSQEQKAALSIPYLLSWRTAIKARANGRLGWGA